jgi:Potential Queuosine, Q, salvage protein family
VSDVLSELREACAAVASQARHVRIEEHAIAAYGAALGLDAPEPGADPEAHLVSGPREQLAAFWLTLDAVNFGSGWFPTLRKRERGTGYSTIATGIRDRFVAKGPWTAAELGQLDTEEVAQVLGQDPDHELMELFARSLRDLGRHLEQEHAGSFAALVDSARGSAPALVERLAAYECFADVSGYGGLRVPFLKRAQLAAADLARAGVAPLSGLDRLTIFADNLVPHVLRLDGILRFDPELVERIERGELIEHGAPEEVEIRACALHAVELIVAQRPGSRAADLDQLLWLRGQGSRYKASPRHRSRCTAY